MGPSSHVSGLPTWIWYIVFRLRCVSDVTVSSGVALNLVVRMPRVQWLCGELTCAHRVPLFSNLPWLPENSMGVAVVKYEDRQRYKGSHA
uniref:Secreted protein n=1 Tax=Rhipicephalus appendiculatus TaxID=34631 RepID=A0A131YD90_RHIAP